MLYHPKIYCTLLFGFQRSAFLTLGDIANKTLQTCSGCHLGFNSCGVDVAAGLPDSRSHC
uniref:Uncharacterized protein n=1 Tax=Arundo donax TaxID=35708 RepID=A0A0A9FZX5_ARUDO